MLKKIRYFIEAVLLSILLLFSKVLPALWASNIGAWLGRNIGRNLAASRKARANIKLAFPDKKDTDIEVILIGMWENLGRVMMEYPHIKTIAKHHTTIVGIEDFKKLKDKSPIFVSAHIGNWEICPPAFLIQTGIKVNPVYRAPNNPYVDTILNNIRKTDGALSPIPKSRSGTRNMVKTLKSGEGIGILIDQKFNEGEKLNFFGHPAMTSTHFVTLAQKFDAPIIPLRIERLKGIDFKITVTDPITTTNKSSNEIASATHDILEKWITQRPEQWLWLHRRWMSAAEIERYNNVSK